MDTGNLRSPLSTSKDNYMATLLINGAGRYGCNGLYQILRYKMYDVSELRIGEILRKDIKKWTKIGKLTSGSRLTVSNIGMSSIGISIAQILSLDSTSNLEISHFQRLEKLSLLLIVSGYYDAEKNFKREILVSAESVELLKNLIQFMKSSTPDLPLKLLHHSGEFALLILSCVDVDLISTQLQGTCTTKHQRTINMCGSVSGTKCTIFSSFHWLILDSVMNLVLL